MELLKDYDCIIDYYPEKANVVADALSRKTFTALPSLDARIVLKKNGTLMDELMLKALLLERIKELQKKDDKCLTWFKQGEKGGLKDFEVFDGLPLKVCASQSDAGRVVRVPINKKNVVVLLIRMGTENPGRPNFPMRPSFTPFASAPPTVGPFSPSGPATGSESNNFRPVPPGAPPTMSPFSARFPTPPFPSTTQAPPNRAPPVGKPPFQPPASQVSVPPPSFRPQTQVLPVPMGSLPQNTKFPPSSLNVPQPPTDSSLSGPRPNFQPPFPGYLSNQRVVSQAPSPFPAQQGSFMPLPASPSPFPSQQGSHGLPPPVAANLGYQSRDQMQHPGSAPPTGGVQRLT
ncbi:protein transport protein Sec24-like At3g07100 [Hibiscus syriacus]|uniref:protein transport protein Sec24-like At3g07100 n=1 Tax=Hibiscus syriacus TaxID=106335 RepID=UPI0019250137|nr:protein transport protein Sec24-like At3g07100 [Hibiscus syriacus]